MKKDIDYYLSKGFDRRMAEYFVNGRRSIKSVKANDDFTLTITFDNSEQRLYNVAPLLKPGTVFERIANLESFRRVYVDKERSIAWDIDPNVDSDVVWNNKVDLCPDSCYVDSVPISAYQI